MTIETALVYLESANKNGYGECYLIDKDGNNVDLSAMRVADKSGNIIDTMLLVKDNSYE